jgi:tRNA (mo5U34)-methyltransferase
MALSEPTVDAATAERFLASSSAVWHQYFELAPGVFTPGVSKVDYLYDTAGVPQDLTGATVLDIGTTNGGAAFEAERRGASRVVAVDIFEPSWFGIDALIALLGSRVEFKRASVYSLPEDLEGERFDIVLLWGVLYHLRHPLLALDKVRELTRGTAYIESAVADHELEPELRDRSLARFYRTDELAGDTSNWFAPTVSLLGEWLTSCGLIPAQLTGWPADAPTRGHAVCVPSAGEPEWRGLSYESPVTANVDLG